MKGNAMEDDYYTEVESVPRSSAGLELPLEAGRTLQTVLERGSVHPSTQNPPALGCRGELVHFPVRECL